MLKTILRKEHKNRWERRVALTPDSVAKLHAAGLRIDIESCDTRVFSNASYLAAGAELVQTPDRHDLVLGIKEPPVTSIQTDQLHLCFSHTIKGQEYNMPLLQKFIDQRATLIDYELMTNEQGVRTIAFGRFAGIAGAIDTLWLYVKKLRLNDRVSCLEGLKQTWEYQTVAAAQQALQELDSQSGEPVHVVILGDGKVGQGTREVCEWLGLQAITAKQLYHGEYDINSSWYCIMAKEEIYARLDKQEFDCADYLREGKATHRSRFTDLIDKVDVVLQTSYWTDFYPRHMEDADFKTYADQLPEVLGDISCDINGSFACTKRITNIDSPAFTYDHHTGELRDGLESGYMGVMAIDNLPCELSSDASNHFSQALQKHLPALMQIHFSDDYNDLALDDELKRAIIVYQGELTPDYKYLQEHLSDELKG